MNSIYSKRYHATVQDGRKCRAISYYSTHRKGTIANQQDMAAAYKRLYKEPLAQTARVTRIITMS